VSASVTDVDVAATGWLRRAPLLLWCLWLVVLAICWFDVHSWESSLYAASAEGFVQLAELFSEPGGTALPDVSLYHPYHPLFHAMVRGLWRHVGAPLDVGALTLTVIANKVAAVFAVVVVYRLLRRAGASMSAALIGVLFAASTKAFLFASFAGEAHIISWVLLLLALERTFAALEQPASSSLRQAARVAFVPTAVWCLGACFNVAVAFYGLVPAALLLQSRPAHPGARGQSGPRVRELVASVVIGGLCLLVVYVVVPVVFVDVHSVADYRRLIALYADLPRASPPMIERALDAFFAISAGLVGGSGDEPTVLGRVVLAAIVAGGAACAMWGGLIRRWFFAAWWTVGFVVGEMLLNVARSINGTLYVVVALAAFVVVLADAGPRRLRPWLTVGVLALGAWNVGAVVAPKCFTEGRYESPLRALVGTDAGAQLRDRPVAVYVDHMAVFGDVYVLGHELGVTDITVFVSQLRSGNELFSQHLEAHADGGVCVLSSRPLRLPLDVIVERVVTMPPEVYHFSVNHDEARRPVHKITWLGCRGRRAPPR
jgi:hypothetical protein